MKYDSIIFDLDGTLWDSVDTVVEIWNGALEKNGMAPTMTHDELSRCMGLTIDKIFDRVIPQATPGQREGIKRCCESGDIGLLGEKGGVLYEKVEETLAALSRTHRLFIVSNCNVGYMNAFFKAHGLQKYFTDFECAGRTGLSKGENIRLIAERSKLENPVYVGDTIMDHDAAVEAGVDFIHAAYGFGEVECDVKIKRFEELINTV